MIKNNKLFGLEGILLIILGAFAISWPYLFTLAFERVIGWLFLFCALIQFIRVFRKEVFHPLFSSLLAIIYLIIGSSLLLFPLRGIVSLTLLLLFFFLFQGIFQISFWLPARDKPVNSWLLVSGIFSLLLALLIWSGWPQNSSWVIGFLLGCNLIVLGTFFLLAREKH